MVGDLEQANEILRAADDSDEALIRYAGEAGSPSDNALRMLLASTTETPSTMPADDACPGSVINPRRAFAAGYLVIGRSCWSRTVPGQVAEGQPPCGAGKDGTR